MSKTSLRTYNREIESLIEQNQFEQAIAHARHILQFFPKHINTYRLLGKAYLESQRYGDAADVFQRVLSAIPDDFVSHVGMSIIREDEGNLDEAIWHMERAFEVQPANSAIQGELRRLYGRRDGMEPPKVRLTRGALARMYLKGELYQQSIAELRAALAEDPQRPDLLALLAQAYFLTGQRVEAADTCSVLLKKTPYCLEANRILADILANTERSAETQSYRQRVHTLEPYAAHTSPAAPTPERVPDTAVSLEKLVWTPGQPITGPKGQPEWAASLGVDIGAAAPQKEALPDWLSEQPEKAPPSTPEPSESTPVPPFMPLPSSEETPSLTPVEPIEGEIPEWMKEIGWKPSTGTAEEAPSSEVEIPESPALPAEEIASAEIPDWLQAMAPGEAPLPEQFPPETGEGELPAESPLSDSDALSWLQETPPGPTDSVVTWLEAEQPPLPESPATEMEMGESLDIPDWLKGLDQPIPAQQVEAEPEVEPVIFESGVDETEIEPAPEEAADLPDWLAGAAPAPGTAEVPAAEELPDWLMKGTSNQVEAEAQPTAEIPNWLRDTGSLGAKLEGPAETAHPEIPATPSEVQPSAQAEDEAFAWLESLAAKQGAQEALILKPEDRRETPPDWVLEAVAKEPVESTPPEEPSIPAWPPAETPVQALAEEAVEAAPAKEIPEWLRGLEGGGATGPQAELEGAAELFEELAEEPGAPAEALPADEIPEWLRGLEGAGATGPQAEPEGAAELFEKLAEEPAAPVEALPAEEIPEWLRGLEGAGASAPPSEPEGAAELFEGLAEEPEVPVEALPAEEIPEWLRGLEGGGASAPQAEPEGAAELFEELAEEPEAPVEALPAEEIPEWLRGLEGTGASEAEPVDAVQRFEDLAEGPESPGVVAPDVGAWQLEEQMEPPQVEAEAEAQPSELPDWLRPISPEPDIEGFVQPEEGRAEELSPVQEEVVESGELPGWLSELEPPVEVEPELEMLFSPQVLATEPAEIAPADEAPTIENEPEVISDTHPTRIQPSEATAQPVEPEIPAVELPAEALPEWLRGLGEEQPVIETMTEAPFEEQLPTPAEETALEAPVVMEQAPADLSTEEPAVAGLEAAGTAGIEARETPPELPSWLTDVDQPGAIEEELAWTPPVEVQPEAVSLPSEAPPMVEPFQPEETLPVGLDLNEAGLAELERLPGVGFTRAQSIISYRQAFGPFTSMEELTNVAGFDEDLVESLRDKVGLGEAQPVEPVAEDVDIYQVTLIQARNALIQGQTAQALTHYSSLIKAQQALPDVIQDLNEALYRFPVDVSFWEALGDAHFRIGHLQDALDAYTKAEELIR
jgi:competence ComEA-like helix-hairpin-helix protein